MRVSAKRLWRRIAHYVSQALIKDDMSEVKLIGIDETSFKKGHQYIKPAFAGFFVGACCEPRPEGLGLRA